MNKLRKAILTMTSLALSFGIVTGTRTVTVHADTRLDLSPVYLYRLYNPNSGEHFYTSDQNEQAYLTSIGWNAEGYGWIGEKDNGKPVYRLYNANGGEHHYTLSEKERDQLVSIGWKYEGVGWNSYVDDGSLISKNPEPVYREYNPNAFANNHNYTTDKKEHDHLISLGWRDEGIGWYAKYINELDDVTGFRYDRNTKTFAWNPVEHATGYILEVQKNTGSDYDQVLYQYSLTPSFTWSSDIRGRFDESAGQYRAIVTAFDVMTKDSNGEITFDWTKNHYLQSSYKRDHYLYFEIQ